MNKVMNKGELGSQVVEPPFASLARGRKIELLAQVLSANATTRYGTILAIEGMPSETLVQHPIPAGSVLSPLAEEMRSRGETVKTVGDIMRIAELDQDDIHHLACFCHSVDVSGETAAVRLRSRVIVRR